MKNEIEKILKDALLQLQADGKLPADCIPKSIKIDHCRNPEHGDLASNIAMMLAKPIGMKPRDLAELIIAALPDNHFIVKTDIAGPGFINFTLSKASNFQIIKDILKQGELFGHNDTGKDQAIHIEYVSANPTGPLHVGHGRSAAYGSCVSNLLKASGYTVHREYYVNDHGRQMDILATSVWLRYLEKNGAPFDFPTNGYKGDYVFDIAECLQQSCQDKLVHPLDSVFADVPADEPKGGDKEKHIDALIHNAKKLLGKEYNVVFDLGLNSILDDIKEDLAEFRVTYDEWFSEKQLSTLGMIDHCIEVLTQAGHMYEKDGAVWFKSTAFGDDKDRVVKRANGATTYFASDIAYHLNKLERGYHTIIDVLGADHHGYVMRLKAGMTAMAGRGDALHVQLIQFVSLFRGSEKIAMTTRGGQFVTLRTLRDEVGNDAARYFYIMRKTEQPLDFDLKLATSQSNDNPVYYIQYAHARICSVWRQLENEEKEWNQTVGEASLNLLETEGEQNLVKKLQQYQEIIIRAATQFEPHLLAHYLYEVANAYHAYYNCSKFLVEEEALRDARLCLNKATQQVIKNGLSLLGLNAPTKM